jgi:hypothetical protein
LAQFDVDILKQGSMVICAAHFKYSFPYRQFNVDEEFKTLKMTHHFTETSEYHKKKVEGDLYQDHKML